ncbi:hypothetical protein KHP62_01975 [Rhodobacteraceae bacterium NNCM2]|nr:hypothetical protein [Coraliihabitans acroporae]
MTRWTVIEAEGVCLLAPDGVAPGWDLMAEARFPLGHPASARLRRRIAHQVRQDIWRAVRRLRGFRPVVRVETAGGQVAIRAGGRLMGGRASAADTGRIADVIDNKNNQRRWMAHAAKAAV